MPCACACAVYYLRIAMTRLRGSSKGESASIRTCKSREQVAVARCGLWPSLRGALVLVATVASAMTAMRAIVGLFSVSAGASVVGRTHLRSVDHTSPSYRPNSAMRLLASLSPLLALSPRHIAVTTVATNTKDHAATGAIYDALLRPARATYLRDLPVQMPTRMPVLSEPRSLVIATRKQ